MQQHYLFLLRVVCKIHVILACTKTLNFCWPPPPFFPPSQREKIFKSLNLRRNFFPNFSKTPSTLHHYTVWFNNTECCTYALNDIWYCIKCKMVFSKINKEINSTCFSFKSIMFLRYKKLSYNLKYYKPKRILTNLG